MEQLHATCVIIDGTGTLLRGPPGAGKSDLALRLIDGGARLVADDRVDLRLENGSIIAAAPPALAGLIEVRGLGIVKLDAVAQASIALVIDLVGAELIERLPAPESTQLMDITLSLLHLAPFEASAPAKVRLAAGLAAGSIIRADD